VRRKTVTTGPKTDTIQYVVVHAIDLREPWRVLLVLKDRPEHLKGRLNLLGGKIEPGESITEAAIRELKEESGLDPQPVGNTSVEYAGKIEGTRCVIYSVIVPVERRRKRFWRR
jgi:8-oxo-dGTP pyrophosphatase MutT (NUDIX family)